MRWLMMLAAIVLGAGITWLLTVRRVTRQVGQSSAPVDEAAGFGGSATHESSSRLGWDRASQDEDALFLDELPARERDVTDVLPIAGATPNGDLAGVTAPRADAEPTPADPRPSAGAPGPDFGASEPRDQPGAESQGPPARRDADSE